jgi:hypothetical protein
LPRLVHAINNRKLWFISIVIVKFPIIYAT